MYFFLSIRCGLSMFNDWYSILLIQTLMIQFKNQVNMLSNFLIKNKVYSITWLFILLFVFHFKAHFIKKHLTASFMKCSSGSQNLAEIHSFIAVTIIALLYDMLLVSPIIPIHLNIPWPSQVGTVNCLRQQRIRRYSPMSWDGRPMTQYTNRQRNFSRF